MSRPNPLLQGILPFDRSRLWPEAMAGVTLAAIGIPEVMGYTKIIGTPVVTGLYTMLLPMLAFALLGSSRHLVVSADSATAAMVAAALTTLAFTPGDPQYVALTGLVALVAAGMLLAARVLRLGFLADFLSRTVLVGFLSGVGIQVAFGELHGMLGLEGGGHGFFRQLGFTLRHLPDTQMTSLAISLVVLGVIVGCEVFAPRLPGALLAVAGMIAASAWFAWGEHGVRLVGAVPGGLPRLGLPAVAWASVPMVLPIAFSCCIVILAQSAATSRAYALRDREALDPNADLLGLCLANAAAGCSGAFVVNGSPTKTAIVDGAGGRSQVANLSTVATVLLVLLFLTRPLTLLPSAALAAIVFLIGVHLVDYRGLAEIRRRKPKEYRLAIVTAATVVVLGVEQGILLALVLSLLQHVRHNYQPHTGVIVRDPDEHFRLDPTAPGKLLEPGLVMYWFGANLFYANAGHFAEEARRLVTGSPVPVRWLVVDAGAIADIDYSAGLTLRELHQDLARQGVVLALARASASLREDLDDHDLTRVIGAGHIFDSRHESLEAFHAETRIT
jgi:MFS superfamily sulfate permease-like transporter